jgi:two-component system, LytTR family, response regulator
VVQDGARLSLLEVELIDWFESAGNYVKVHSDTKDYLVRTTMDRVAQRLAARHLFVRVRRSALVDIAAVAALERHGKGTYVVQLKDGAKVISSRYYQPALRQLLKPDA